MKFRKKGDDIEAIEFVANNECLLAIRRLCTDDAVCSITMHRRFDARILDGIDSITLYTRSGQLNVTPGMWVVRTGPNVYFGMTEKELRVMYDPVPPDPVPPEPAIDENFVSQVEDLVGMGSNAWDMVSPIELCNAVVNMFRAAPLEGK